MFRKNKTHIAFFWITFAFFVSFSCNKEDRVIMKDEGVGNLTVKFLHQVDGELLQTDTMKYTNHAGNPYLVSEIQYFISDVKLVDRKGNKTTINQEKEIHYIDTDIESTQKWDVYDDIPTGEYDSIVFVFGFTKEKNQSFMFVNPPERDMFWPEFLGGGYHYMKLNGKWKEPGGSITPFDFHMGIGQIYENDTVNVNHITGFVHNHFMVKLPLSDMTIEDEQSAEIQLVMQIENWFKNPHTYNHNEWGGYIMQNQEAMQIAKENGHNVFTAN